MTCSAGLSFRCCMGRVGCCRDAAVTGAGKTHTMMGSERVVGGCGDGSPGEVSGIVPQSLVELFGLLEGRAGARQSDSTEPLETWNVRVGYLQVTILSCLFHLFRLDEARSG